MVKRATASRHVFLPAFLAWTSASCCELKSISQVNHQPIVFINFSLSHAGSFKGMCKQIDHFPEDADYEADASEYFLRESSSTFKSNAEVIFCVSAAHTPSTISHR